MGGVGKSYTVLQHLERLEITYKLFNSRMTVKGLFRALEKTGATFEARPAPQVQERDCCRWLIDGTQGIRDLPSMPDWPLPWAVHAHYDLRHAESGPCVKNPDLAQYRSQVNEDGGPVLKRPPF